MVDILAFYFLLVLFVFFLIKKRILGIICLSVILLMVICDIVSFLLLNEHITYISILRTDLDMIKMSINIIPSIVILSIIGILVHIYIYMYTRNLNFKKYIWVLIIPVIFAFMYPHSFVAYKNVVKSFAKLYKYNNYDISKIFSDVGNQDRYIFLDEIYASKGKNLVVIYCESFDDAFIKRKVFEKETKHLRQLCQDEFVSYNNYIMLKGAHWTTGALYATQTGLPTFFFENYFYKHKKVNNSIFSDDDNIYANKAVSWAKVLKKAGYDNWFMSNSNLNFSGTGKIMEALGYKTIEVQVKNDNRKSEWGPYDKNLFDKAKEKYVELNNGSKPFNLTLLTIDMHFPNGVQDNYLIPYIDKSIKFDSHEFSVASADYLLYNFIDFIKKNDKNNNTAIVVMGDHCMMGNKKITPIVGKLKNKKHRILFMTNKKINEYQPNDKIYFYDIPKIMLEVAGVNTNAKFPKDIIKNISPSYILKNQELFTILNEKLYNRKDKSS